MYAFARFYTLPWNQEMVGNVHLVHPQCNWRDETDRWVRSLCGIYHKKIVEHPMSSDMLNNFCKNNGQYSIDPNEPCNMFGLKCIKVSLDDYAKTAQNCKYCIAMFEHMRGGNPI